MYVSFKAGSEPRSSPITLWSLILLSADAGRCSVKVASESPGASDANHLRAAGLVTIILGPLPDSRLSENTRLVVNSGTAWLTSITVNFGLARSRACRAALNLRKARLD